jgi:hypothetical protein
MQELAPGTAFERVESRIDSALGRRADLLAMITVGVGFLLRVRAAWGIFLNPDEALHFSLANQSSFSAAYHASLTLAHPPLLVLLLYFWRVVGSSDFVLRLPSILAGTAFCWIFYRWMKDVLGELVGLIGVTMIALLPPIIALTSEVRQYSLLLLFITCAAFLLERALAKRSESIMTSSFVCLWLAMLSHYSALIFAAAFAIYSGWRLIRDASPPRVMVAWAAGNLGACALFEFLYRTQIAQLKDSPLAEQAMMKWLHRSYFHAGDNLIVFIVGRSFAVSQFIFGQLVVGDITALLFIAGVILLIRSAHNADAAQPSPRRIALFLIAPFVINCVLALMGKYPYGGTRHCVFLAPFAIAGISFFIVRAARDRLARGFLITLVIVGLCYAFGFHHQPYMERADQSSVQMDNAMNFIKTQIPATDPAFVDEQANLMLRHYLCRQMPGKIGVSGFQQFRCAGHQIISTPPRMWMFTPETFPTYWSQMISQFGLQPGTGIWVVQAGWGASIAPDLQRVRPDLRPEKIQNFGQHISMLQLKVNSAE